MGQWLGPQASTARDMGLILVRELRPHKLCGADKIKTEWLRWLKNNLKRQLNKELIPEHLLNV